LVKDTLKSTQSAEDVATRPTTFRTRDALLVDSLIRKSESITGLRRLPKEREKAMAEWPMSRRLSEEPKMDSDITLLPRLNQESKTETNNVRLTTVLFLIIFSIF
jgi:hypothetical protein